MNTRILMYDTKEGIALPYDLSFSPVRFTDSETGKKSIVYMATSYLGLSTEIDEVFALTFLILKRPKTYKLAVKPMTLLNSHSTPLVETIQIKKVFKTFKEAVIYSQAISSMTIAHNFRCKNEDLRLENFKFKEQFQKFNLLLPKK